ncbi:MAG: hypothetical protein U0842_21630 [Candidatus Binatia bacterium]
MSCRRLGRRFVWLALAAAVVLVPSAARAHRSNVKANLVRVVGTGGGYLNVRPSRGGWVELDFPGHPQNGKLSMDFRINGVPTIGVVYPIDSDKEVWRLAFGVRDQDKLEISNVRVLDGNGQTYAVLGSDIGARGRDVFSSPLVWVVDTLSDVGFTRGGDTILSRSGKWTIGFDALRSRATNSRLNNAANRAEIEYSVNGGPWLVDTVSFDVQSGKSRPNGRPGKQLAILSTDHVEVRRVDVLDSGGRKFATMGVRMGNQGHYLESVPTLVPTPSPTPSPSPSPTPTITYHPTPTPTPSPTQTPEVTPTYDPTESPAPTPTLEPTATPDPTPTDEPTATPGPTPSPDPTPAPTPDPTASPDPTPDPTPSPDPTPDPTPSPDPTPDPTPSPDPTPDPTPTEEPTPTP